MGVESRLGVGEEMRQGGVTKTGLSFLQRGGFDDGELLGDVGGEADDNSVAEGDLGEGRE